MGFRQGAFAKVWKFENKGNYDVAQISISRKNKETNQYEVEFQDGFVRFVGNAHEEINNVDFPEKNGLTIKITSCDVTNHYDKEKKITYTNYVIFGFELPNNESESSSKPAKKSAKKVEEDDTVDSFAEAEDDLPF